MRRKIFVLPFVHNCLSIFFCDEDQNLERGYDIERIADRMCFLKPCEVGMSNVFTRTFVELESLSKRKHFVVA